MEETYYDRNGVLVTQTRFVVGNQTYAMRNITSVRYELREAETSAPKTVLFITAAIGLVAYLTESYITCAICGLIVAALIYLIMGIPKKYAVVLTTSGGEEQALEHINGGFIKEVVAALNQSIISHA